VYVVFSMMMEIFGSAYAVVETPVLPINIIKNITFLDIIN